MHSPDLHEPRSHARTSASPSQSSAEAFRSLGRSAAAQRKADACRNLQDCLQLCRDYASAPILSRCDTENTVLVLLLLSRGSGRRLGLANRQARAAGRLKPSPRARLGLGFAGSSRLGLRLEAGTSKHYAAESSKYMNSILHDYSYHYDQFEYVEFRGKV